MFRTIFLVFSLISICIGQSGLHLVTHFCGGKKVTERFGFTVENESCGMLQASCNDLLLPGSVKAGPGSCCSDHVFSFDTDDGLPSDLPTISCLFFSFEPLVPFHIDLLRALVSTAFSERYFVPPPDEIPLYLLYRRLLMYSC